MKTVLAINAQAISVLTECLTPDGLVNASARFIGLAKEADNDVERKFWEGMSLSMEARRDELLGHGG